MYYRHLPGAPGSLSDGLSSGTVIPHWWHVSTYIVISSNELVMSQPFRIALMTNKGAWKTLESFDSYDDADDRYDYWADKYPSSLVEILDPTD